MIRFVALLLALSAAALAQDLTPKPIVLREEGVQSDFPALALDAAGTPWVAYVGWDAKQDTLRLAKASGATLSQALTIGQPGIIHQPALATDGSGALVVVWSQVNERDLMDLKAQRVRNGKPEGGVTTLAASVKGGNAFARAATDRAGRVWVAWQGMRGGLSDVFCRYFDPAKNEWSKEVQVTGDPGGDWEPCIAFDDKAGAWICYDSSRGNEFNVYATRIALDGTVGATKPLIRTPRYEGRVSAIGTADGKGVWIACERGRMKWGLDIRAHGHLDGLNAQKNMVLAYWDIASGKVDEAPDIEMLLEELPGPPPLARRSNVTPASKSAAKKATAARNAKVGPAAKVAQKAKAAVLAMDRATNLPQITLDAEGRPWIAVRYYRDYTWRIALTRYDRATRQWTKPWALPDSLYTEDRQSRWALGKDGAIWLAWSTDRRISKEHLTSEVHLAKLEPKAIPALVKAPAPRDFRQPPAYINPETPERDRAERYTMTNNGVTYQLYWGDYHRHTDISNCVTANDGCVLEQFRYALDMGKLDTLGTSDHTDIAKIYDPYEWWLNQKMVDVFHAPGFFVSMYAYEREQVWPYGHRNMIFAQRGGPIVYIQRANYAASPWQKIFPLPTEGEAQIAPEELWDVLHRYGQSVSVISHTGATNMGTDWNVFKRVDNRVENLIEIFQGARVSYEGRNAPQPTVGLRVGEGYNHASVVDGTPVVGQPISSFTVKNNGLYQNALSLGHKLGVWADSDHISTHTSYGGVYVKEFTREGIIEGLNARRTIAATDKIFVEFQCNGQLLGSQIEVSGKPVMSIKVNGTAAITRVTLVRNEQNYRQWEPGTKTFAQSFTDDTPANGENRYYLRIEQGDGNMAWSSPVWARVK
ncbi:MAG: hypothetical protein Q7S40_27015 [Opitutaceae bacterium]|nr:hypothetical protein [Opitutaceae bacterium]